MRLTAVPLLLSALAVGAIACSGDSDTKKDAAPVALLDATVPPDARVTPDAPAGSPDAAMTPDAGTPDVARDDAPSDAPADAAADTTPDVSVDAALPMTNLAAPWKHLDVGDVGLVGASAVAAGAYTITGSGADIWGTADAFTFAHQAFSGDGEIVARVVSVEETDVWAKGGVMFRSSLAAAAPNVALFGTAKNGTSMQWRPTEGAESMNWQAASAVPPRWIKLVRSGKTFSGYFSSDGVSWFRFGGVEVDMPNDILIGLAVTAHNNGLASKSVIDNVTIKKYPPYPAGLDAGATVDGGVADGGGDALAGAPPAAPWTTGDIGMVGVKGAAIASGTGFVLSGSGADIWGMADAFTYVFQQLAGDGEITARVGSVEQTDVWSKAGIMVRATLEPGSPHVMAIGTAANGMRVQYRPMDSADSVDLGVSFIMPPGWVRLVRVGGAVTSFVSRDGVAWLEIARTEVPLPASVYVGLVTTSHNNAVAAQAVIDNVTVKAYPPGADGGARD